MKTPSNDGGAAFPVVDGYHKDGRHRGGESGMTLRDYFAGQALNGMISGDAQPYISIKESADGIVQEGETASRAYRYADSMLAARERKEDAP